MHFIFKPSLEHRALIKIAILLWNQDDVRALMCLIDPVYSPLNEKWKEIEAKVLERVPQLSLPQLLKEKVSSFIQAIGLEIYEYIKFFCKRYKFLRVNLPFELCWTPQGTVDGKRTAEVLVKNESLDIAMRYELACFHCLENDIIALWNTLSEDLRQSFLLGNPQMIGECYENWLINYWSCIMKRRLLDNAHASNKYGFEQSAYRGNKAAVEYFLQKLTPREKEESLVETAKSVMYVDVLCFLISEMDEQQTMELFKGDPHGVLLHFLKWPFQSFLIKIANHMWDFIPKKSYENVLKNIIEKVREGYKDCNYNKLFREFWKKSSDALKSLITNELDNSQLLPDLFYIKDKEIIRLIFHHANLTAKEKLIYNDTMYYFWQDCIDEEEWDFFEFCIRECFPSEDLMIKFKQEFENCKKRKSVEDILVRNKLKWNKLFLIG